MDNLEYLFAGFAVFWAGLFIYLLWLQARIRMLHREIEQLEERLAEAEGGHHNRAAPNTGSRVAVDVHVDRGGDGDPARTGP